MADFKAPITILTFRGFGNDRRIHIDGQVAFSRRASVERPRVGEERQRLWGRIREALSLAISPRVPRARLRVHCGGVSQEVTTDSHGYFSASLELPRQSVTALWREYLVELIEPSDRGEVTGRGRILTVTAQSHRVIVSDIDDTIIFTGVSNKLKMLWRLFAHDAEERVPFPGISALYRGFHYGRDGQQENPMIYVSRSPWSIYPILDEFFQMHDIPAGPVLHLRDWGVSLRHPFPRRAGSYKEQVLKRIVAIYPDLPLVLIGDSGQHDPELYSRFTREHPKHVAAIYIRDLRLSQHRSAELEEMQRELERQDVPLIVGASTEEMATDAARRGWLSDSDLVEINQRSADGQP